MQWNSNSVHIAAS